MPVGVTRAGCTCQFTSTGLLRILDTTATSIGNVATLAAGVAYDVSLTCTIGASTNDSQVTAKVYLLNSDTQVGSTFSSSTANLSSSASAGATWLESFYMGATGSEASDIGFHWDFLRFENDRGEFPAPISASANMIINSESGGWRGAGAACQ